MQINGLPIEGLSHEQVVARIAQSGTSLKLKLLRPAQHSLAALEIKNRRSRERGAVDADGYGNMKGKQRIASLNARTSQQTQSDSSEENIRPHTRADYEASRRAIPQPDGRCCRPGCNKMAWRARNGKAVSAFCSSKHANRLEFKHTKQIRCDSNLMRPSLSLHV